MKKAMRRYRPDDMPVVCLDCGGTLRYDPARFAWQHAVKGADHAPRVSGAVRS